MRNQDKSVTKLLHSNLWILQDNIVLPENVHSKEEMILGILLGLWIAQSKVNVVSNDDFQEGLKLHFLKSKSPDLFNFLILITKQCKEDIDYSKIKPINKKSLSDDIFGSWLQHSLSTEKRKLLAVNYTSRTDELIDFIMPEKLKIKSVIDPFSGSARLIIGILRKYPVNIIIKIVINDIMPVALLLGYCRIINEIKNFDQKIVIHSSIKDGFSLRGKFSLVIMNPPFTRSQLISDNLKKEISHLSKSYSEFNQGQAGLHVWAIYLANELLENNGTLVSIIPSATILSRYSKGVQHILLNNYPVFSLSSSLTHLSYSEDSDFRELVLYGCKREAPDKIQFSLITEGKEWVSYRSIIKLKIELENDWNWNRYFRSESLLNIRKEMLNSCKLKSGKEAELTIKRGVEMYGPDFFFFPNKKWNIEIKNEVTMIYNQESIVSLPTYYFIKILRKPVLYTKKISPDINEYALSIPPEPHLLPNIHKLVELNQEETQVAKKRFGSNWLNHINDQLNKKQPFGQLFVVDKFGLGTTSILSHYTDSIFACTKNFYVIQLSPLRSKLLAAWMNSTLYLALYLCSRREIGGSYGRMQIIDFLEEPLFPDKILKISLQDTKVKEILHIFDEMRNFNLPPLPKQLHNEVRLKLDFAIAKLIGLKYDIHKLHSDIKSIITELITRDKSKSKSKK